MPAPLPAQPSLLTVAADTAEAAIHLTAYGCAVLPDVFNHDELEQLIQLLNRAEATSTNFRRTKDLFAIRNLLGEIPDLQALLFTPKLQQLAAALFPTTPHLTKAIYFDKPAQSNWLVAWHQDLMISVNQRQEAPGFGPWTDKQGDVSVQPPRAVSENICTLRLHLDDCDASNGALKVVLGSHRHGAILAQELPQYTLHAVACPVPAGGVMLMKPLTLHASNRSTSPRSRRVIHLEFSSLALPYGLQWREQLPLFSTTV